MSEHRSRREFMQTAAGLTVVAGSSIVANAADTPAEALSGSLEWRNKQPGMHYRRLGRTGLMISEVISGGDPITSSNYQHLNLALEMGLNYLDMAPAYSMAIVRSLMGNFWQGPRNAIRCFCRQR